VERLIAALESGEDFRLRVSAALELGKVKTKKDKARAALERALDDANAAVRAASVAALRVLGDSRAVPALRRALKDDSPAVRAQAQSAIDALSGASDAAETARHKEIVVELGEVKNATSSGKADKSLDRDLQFQSQRALQRLPGVRVVSNKNQERPEVMLTGKLHELKQTRDGNSVVCDAQVEYILHQMPGRAIRGRVSGSAKVRDSASILSNKRALAELRQSALEAAIDSAMKRAKEAMLLAAAR
jgi:hypothetical protein